ncbi:MAG: efflux RND transporter permease subunit, partial [Alphaproteobacteria bacterium]|nr:efflux RND transporter permease subunit [Alphaproteobacteria bacterium]
PGANAIEAMKGIRKAMAELAESFPKGMAWEIPYDATDYVTMSIAEIRVTLFITFTAATRLSIFFNVFVSVGTNIRISIGIAVARAFITFFKAGKVGLIFGNRPTAAGSK